MSPQPPQPPTSGEPIPDPVPDNVVLPEPAIADVAAPTAVQLTRSYEPPTTDQWLWAIIQNRAQAI